MPSEHNAYYATGLKTHSQNERRSKRARQACVCIVCMYVCIYTACIGLGPVCWCASAVRRPPPLVVRVRVRVVTE